MERANKRQKNFGVLTNRILRLANQALPRIQFLKEVSKIILEFSGCDTVGLRTKERGKYFGCLASREPRKSIKVEVLSLHDDEQDETKSNVMKAPNTDLERLSRQIVIGHTTIQTSFITRNGSFWIGDAEIPLKISGKNGRPGSVYQLWDGDKHRTVALVPFAIDEGNNGLLQLLSKKREFFGKDDIELYEGLAQTVGLTVVDRRAQETLRERVKELSCLYSIARTVESPDVSMPAVLQTIVELLPPAWLYPEVTCARMVLDDASFTTKGFRETPHKLIAPIVMDDVQRGVVEVIYQTPKPELDEGPFLKEERHLINAVAKQVGQLVERKQAEEDKTRLQEQIRHADRLATIGQLAAGMAHELNEPLGSILGFAQLIQKTAGMPEQAEHDLEKIVSASLYARDVIRKLLIFSRKTPAKLVKADLNQLVQSGLYFLEARCAKAGIELVKELSASSPMILADAAQMHQILINLAVNAIHAMPNGGELTIRTQIRGDSVELTVEDNGIGMTEAVKRQIFVPFFTTKDVNEGTGLGLPVVHGIVTTHGGDIRVDSVSGRGTKFEITLPLWQPKTSVADSHG